MTSSGLCRCGFLWKSQAILFWRRRSSRVADQSCEHRGSAHFSRKLWKRVLHHYGVLIKEKIITLLPDFYIVIVNSQGFNLRAYNHTFSHLTQMPLENVHSTDFKERPKPKLKRAFWWSASDLGGPLVPASVTAGPTSRGKPEGGGPAVSWTRP